MQEILSNLTPYLQIDPLLLASTFGSLVLFGLVYFGFQSVTQVRHRSEVQKRLEINKSAGEYHGDVEGGSKKAKRSRKVASKVAKKTNDFYSTSDPKSMRRIQLSLIQAGFMNPSAVGYFLAARFGLGITCAMGGILAALTYFGDLPITNKILIILLSGTAGYFAPNIYISQRTSNLQSENRAGFPDVMDLMVVAAEAGLTTEASIERIAKEIEKTYPILSAPLNIAALEVRAGRPLDQALHGFGERLGLDEIQGFATMIQQSKELGTSVSDALRVFSDEMRHKRMMAAEEKAYALPAKMSIPVTVFILPIVIGVAVIPTAVRMITGTP